VNCPSHSLREYLFSYCRELGTPDGMSLPPQSGNLSRMVSASDYFDFLAKCTLMILFKVVGCFVASAKYSIFSTCLIELSSNAFTCSSFGRLK
jgi:hypothetical protein